VPPPASVLATAGMSFNDISPLKAHQRSSSTSSSKGLPSSSSSSTSSAYQHASDPLLQLSDALLSFQKQCVVIKDRITELRRRKVGPSEKNDLDMQIRGLRDLENKLKNQLDNLARQMESAPKSSETVQKRIALGKLQKDFERVKVGLHAITTESALIKVTTDVGGSGSGSSSSGSGGTGVFTGGRFSRTEDVAQYNNSNTQGREGPILIQHMVGAEVDAAIMEERERDIRKINKDLALVNEMFKDMAQIVESQGTMIEEIHETTEKSHDRAKAGLAQVQQAAAYQPGCLIS